MSDTEEGRELCMFCPGGSHLAVSRLDGDVQVWETASGRLKQRFSPGGMRAGRVKCLAWSRQLEMVRVNPKTARSVHREVFLC